MKKDNLMAGYAIKYRDGGVRIVVNSEKGMGLVSPNQDGRSWCLLTDFKDDLSHKIDDALDIVEVFGLSNHPLYALDFSEGTRELLWKRDKPKIFKVIISDTSSATPLKLSNFFSEHVKVYEILIPFDWQKNDVYINGATISYPESQLTLGEICNRDNTDSVRITIMSKTKEMTVAEIEKELGYRVKIIK